MRSGQTIYAGRDEVNPRAGRIVLRMFMLRRGFQILDDNLTVLRYIPGWYDQCGWRIWDLPIKGKVGA